MKEDAIVKQSYDLIRKDLGLKEEWSFEGVDNSFDRLQNFLEDQIGYLLDYDFNKLLNALYRIDIPESEVKSLLNGAGNLPQALARAVIIREKEKVLTRLKYRS